LLASVVTALESGALDVVAQRNHHQCPGGQALLAVDDLILVRSLHGPPIQRLTKENMVITLKIAFVSL
jgi:hypothetical protein